MSFHTTFEKELAELDDQFFHEQLHMLALEPWPCAKVDSNGNPSGHEICLGPDPHYVLLRSKGGTGNGGKIDKIEMKSLIDVKKGLDSAEFEKFCRKCYKHQSDPDLLTQCLVVHVGRRATISLMFESEIQRDVAAFCLVYLFRANNSIDAPLWKLILEGRSPACIDASQVAAVDALTEPPFNQGSMAGGHAQGGYAPVEAPFADAAGSGEPQSGPQNTSVLMKTLWEMGFHDTARNREALKHAGNSLEGAADWLLANPPSVQNVAPQVEAPSRSVPAAHSKGSGKGSKIEAKAGHASVPSSASAKKSVTKKQAPKDDEMEDDEDDDCDIPDEPGESVQAARESRDRKARARSKSRGRKSQLSARGRPGGDTEDAADEEDMPDEGEAAEATSTTGQRAGRKPSGRARSKSVSRRKSSAPAPPEAPEQGGPKAGAETPRAKGEAKGKGKARRPSSAKRPSNKTPRDVES